MRGNSLQTIHPGKSIESVLGRTPANVMDQAGENFPRKSIRIRKDELQSALSPKAQFEAIVSAIANVARTSRHQVENALIATGSTKAVRRMKPKRLNSEIQNRLVQSDAKGEEFRNYMTLLVVDQYGGSLMNDSFFRKPGENQVGSNGLVNPWSNQSGGWPSGVGLQTGTNPWSNQSGGWPSGVGLQTGTNPGGFLSGQTGSTASGSVTGLEATPNGGVNKTNNSQDWGSILSGSAQVINSVGGVIGLFTGGNQGTENNNVFDESSSETPPPPPPPKPPRVGLIVGLVIGAVAIGVLVWYLTKNKDKK